MRQIRLRQRMSDKLSRGSLMVLLAQYATTLPLYIGTIDGHPPPLVFFLFIYCFMDGIHFFIN